MLNDSQLLERAQTAEAIANTLRAQVAPLKLKVQAIKAAFGVRERSNGTYDIDFATLARGIGFDQALELRRVIDEIYGISGEAGQKPRVKATAVAA